MTDVRRFGDLNDDEAPRAVIERVGRWTYDVHVEDGMSRYGPMGGLANWRVLGRGRAERKARRVLRDYLSHGDVSERWEVRP